MRKFPTYFFIAAASLAATAAFAQETGDELDGVEMDVLAPGETPEQAARRIALPDEASDRAVEKAARGHDTANAAREGRAEYGQSVAESHREGAGDRGKPDDVGAPDGTPAPEVPGRP